MFKRLALGVVLLASPAFAASVDLNGRITLIGGDVVALHAMVQLPNALAISGKTVKEPVIISYERSSSRVLVSLLGKSTKTSEAKTAVETFRRDLLATLRELAGLSAGLTLDEADVIVAYLGPPDGERRREEIGRSANGEWTVPFGR